MNKVKKHRKAKQSAKQSVSKKTYSGGKKANQVVFFSNQLCNKNHLPHYIRIPEVMAIMNKARYIFKNKGFVLPLWLWGLVEKGDKWNSTYDGSLMSFLLNVALYDRFVRVSSVRPEFLIGSSLALDVCAKVRTFESSLMDIMCYQGAEQQTVRVYKRKPHHSSYFSLQYFSYKGDSALKDLKNHRITRCVSVLPLSVRDKKRLSASCLTSESMIKNDVLLSWLWGVLNKNSVSKSQYVRSC